MTFCQKCLLAITVFNTFPVLFVVCLVVHLLLHETRRELTLALVMPLVILLETQLIEWLVIVQ